MATFTDTTTFVVEECCKCGVQFGVTSALHQRRLKDRDWFYCPNGHAQHYVGKTEAQKLKERLAATERDRNYYREQREAARQLANHERARANGYKGALTKAKKRISKGVCPCCNRHFDNVQSHMETEHPDYAGASA